jgi:uncharacterized protein YciI
MKQSVLFLFAATALAQAPPPASGHQPVPYVFGFLRAHPKKPEIPKEEAEAIQRAHLDHLGKMSRTSGLVGAGPLANSPDLRGVLIFKGVSLAEARAAANQDPAVRNQRLVADLADWASVPGIGDGIASALKTGAPDALKMTRHGLVVLWKTAQAPPNPGAPEFAPLLERQRVRSMELVSQGQLLAFGPLTGSQDLLAVLITPLPDLERALALAKDDPMVAGGWARPEAFVWFVAEGVMPDLKRPTALRPGQ